jgi:hypothetical protein
MSHSPLLRHQPMSDTILRLVPTSHTFIPSATEVAQAIHALEQLCPRAQEVTASIWDKVMFVDCGGNLDSISCVHCGADQLAWFFDETSRKYEANKLMDLQVKMPCCGASSSLNELKFDWPAGFASASIDVLIPDRDWLSDSELAQVSQALGHPVRQILAHY